MKAKTDDSIFLNVENKDLPKDLPDFSKLFSERASYDDFDVHNEQENIEAAVLSYFGIVGRVFEHYYSGQVVSEINAKMVYAEIKVDAGLDCDCFYKINFSGYFFENKFYILSAKLDEDYFYDKIFSPWELRRTGPKIKKILADYRAHKLPDNEIWVTISFTPTDYEFLPRFLSSEPPTTEYYSRISENMKFFAKKGIVCDLGYGYAFYSKISPSSLLENIERVHLVEFIGNKITYCHESDFKGDFNLDLIARNLRKENLFCSIIPECYRIFLRKSIGEKFHLTLIINSSGSDLPIFSGKLESRYNISVDEETNAIAKSENEIRSFFLSFGIITSVHQNPVIKKEPGFFSYCYEFRLSQKTARKKR